VAASDGANNKEGRPVMARTGKTGGQVNESTGRVERGRIPRGHSLDDVATVRHFGLGDSIRALRGKR
jgi:hypothetical protein